MAVVATGMITLTDLNDSKQMQLYITLSGVPGRQQTYDPNTGVYNPHYPTTKPVLSPELYVAGTSTNVIGTGDVKSIKWFVDGTELTANTADYTMAASGVKTLTINTNVLASVNSKRFEVQVTYTDPDTTLDSTMKADIELFKITGGAKGANAITAYLSNETQAVPANASGTVLSFSGATTTLKIFEGSTDVTASWTIAQTRTNVTVTEATTSATATITAMTADTGSVLFTATRSGYSTVTKTFGISKTKGGADATTYDIFAEGVIKRSTTGVYNPTAVTVKARQQVGQNAPADYAGRFIIAEQDAAGNWSNKYTSSANEATKAYTPSTATIKAIKVTLYAAGGTTTVLDEQSIPVVDDGNDPIFTFVSAPGGNTVSDTKSTTIQCDLYKGINIVTGTYVWYVQEPLQTTDQGAGVGWRILNNNGTAPTAASGSSVGASGGTVAAGTYYIKYTWLTATGETVTGPEKTQAVTAGQTLIITPPAFPTGVYGANIYVGKTAGANKLQGKVSTSGGNLTITKPIFENTVTPPTAYTGVTGASTINDKVLTVPGSAVLGLETFKCIVTYDGNTYSDVVTITDYSDPVQVQIFGVTVFKNGQGTVQLDAVVSKNGVPINDTDETLYTYKWSLYNASNQQNMTFGTSGFKYGRSIQVAATDVDVRGNIYVEVEEK